ncbi:hypothetical protein [Thiolapillus sp.]|uniref:hypothetical protein n=1 Tax=Thiolapillus sp. TaxID=2017437 RepID=UPI003AF91558
MKTSSADTETGNPTPAISEKRLLELIATVLSHYICETNPYVLFNGLLEALLEITSSEYGFIGEVFYDDKNQPYVKCYATTNIAWDSDTRKLYEENRQKGMIFSKLDSLYGSVLQDRPAGDLQSARRRPPQWRTAQRPPSSQCLHGTAFLRGRKTAGDGGYCQPGQRL